VLDASIIRVLMMEAASTSQHIPEDIFILAAVRT
jgi:hypothetical protein